LQERDVMRERIFVFFYLYGVQEEKAPCY